MTALLGLLAVAGYQNRDKLAELFRGQGTQPAAPGGSGGLGDALGRPGSGSASSGGLGGLLGGGGSGGLGGLLGGAGSAGLGGLLGGGLSDLVEQFRRSGHGDVADSWVGTGPNREIAPNELERAIGPEVLDTLTRETGLDRQEILSRLSRNLPDAVDRYTPDGRLPSEADLSSDRA
jgi:uncharacterized protein YidB (DUF937 family)